MKDKVIWYVYATWYGVHCHKREDIEKIVDQVITENQDITNYVKLGILAKRRCQNELA